MKGIDLNLLNDELRKEIIEIGKRVYHRGFVASNDGNFSIKIDDDKVLITATGISKGFMTNDDIILMNLDGEILEGTKKPSSEFNMHLQIYKDRADVKSVCHAHPPYATGFAVAGIPLDKMILPEVIIALGKVPLVDYGTPGTPELYNAISKYINEYDVFLLANHGALSVGDSLTKAYHKLETLELAAHIQFIAQQLGKVNTLNNDQTNKLIDLRENFGIRKNIGSKNS